jgi:hypothetical protein
MYNTTHDSVKITGKSLTEEKKNNEYALAYATCILYMTANETELKQCRVSRRPASAAWREAP